MLGHKSKPQILRRPNALADEQTEESPEEKTSVELFCNKFR
jgi:hypothetical protein